MPNVVALQLSARRPRPAGIQTRSRAGAIEVALWSRCAAGTWNGTAPLRTAMAIARQKNARAKTGLSLLPAHAGRRMAIVANRKPPTTRPMVRISASRPSVSTLSGVVRTITSAPAVAAAAPAVRATAGSVAVAATASPPNEMRAAGASWPDQPDARATTQRSRAEPAAQARKRREYSLPANVTSPTVVLVVDPMRSAATKATARLARPANRPIRLEGRSASPIAAPTPHARRKRSTVIVEARVGGVDEAGSTAGNRAA